MPTISLCMIVKNEEAVLARCLDSVADLMDEMIIVDTGSTDRTKEIASRYTDRVYDFPWGNDFSAARNFSFSLASMDYIYAPDADEVLDAENHYRFAQLKEVLLPEIEIVQMKYRTVDHDTVLNVKNEYRPKLFKRMRSFTWEDPIHETVRTMPVVYDSDIEILHMPQSLHSKRDFSIFIEAFRRDGAFSDKVRSMYARELLKNGDETDFADALPIYQTLYAQAASDDMLKECACVLARIYRTQGVRDEFFKLTLKDMVSNPCSEICYELGQYFAAAQDYEEASVWYYNAAYETESILDVHTGGDLALQGLVECYERLLETAEMAESTEISESAEMTEMGLMEQYREALEEYRKALSEWEMPEEGN